MALAREIVGSEGGDTLTGDAGEDDVAEARPVGGITFGPEDVEDDPDLDGIRIVDPLGPSGQEHFVSPEQINDLEARADDLRAGDGVVSPQLAEEIGLLVLSILPGTGHALSAKEAYDAFRAAEAALRDGDIATALLKAAEGTVATTGAIPVIGDTVRLSRAGIRAASILTSVLKRSRRQLRTLPATRGITQKQKRRLAEDLNRKLGDFSESKRIETLRPRNRFRGAAAFRSMSPKRAFEATRWPPVGAPENVFRGMAAVDRLILQVLQRGSDTVPNAMWRGDLPSGQQAISLRWGKPGEGIDFAGGSGVSHIIAKHGVERLEGVFETIAKGKVLPQRPGVTDRILIERGNDIAILLLQSKGKQETWVLSGYERRGRDAFFDLSQLKGPVFFNGPNR